MKINPEKLYDDTKLFREYKVSKELSKCFQIFIGLPVAVFVVMGARELLPFFDGLVGNLVVPY